MLQQIKDLHTKKIIHKGDLLIVDNNDQNIPFFFSKERAHIYKYLFNEIACKNSSSDTTGYSIIHWAVAFNQIDSVKTLCVVDEQINLQAKNINITPIYIAIIYNRSEIFNYLINSDEINLLSTNKYGLTPLNLAVCTGNLNFVKQIIEKDKGNSLNVADNKDATPLLNAIHLSHTEIAIYLLKQKGIKAAINTQWRSGRSQNQLNSEYGFTALHFAAKNGHSKLLKALLDKGADPNLKNYHGHIPSDYATTNEIKAFLRLSNYLTLCTKKQLTTTKQHTLFGKTYNYGTNKKVPAANALKEYLVSLFNKENKESALKEHKENLKQHKTELEKHEGPLNNGRLGDIYNLCKLGLQEGKQIPRRHSRYYQHTPVQDTSSSEFRNN